MESNLKSIGIREGERERVICARERGVSDVLQPGATTTDGICV